MQWSSFTRCTRGSNGAARVSASHPRSTRAPSQPSGGGVSRASAESAPSGTQGADGGIRLDAHTLLPEAREGGLDIPSKMAADPQTSVSATVSSEGPSVAASPGTRETHRADSGPSDRPPRRWPAALSGTCQGISPWLSERMKPPPVRPWQSPPLPRASACSGVQRRISTPLRLPSRAALPAARGLHPAQVLRALTPIATAPVAARSSTIGRPRPEARWVAAGPLMRASVRLATWWPVSRYSCPGRRSCRGRPGRNSRWPWHPRPAARWPIPRRIPR